MKFENQLNPLFKRSESIDKHSKLDPREIKFKNALRTTTMTMTKKFMTSSAWTTLALIWAVGVMINKAQAADGFVGGVAGVSIVNNDGGMGPEFGVHVVRKLSDQFGVGFFGAHSNTSKTSTLLGRSIEYKVSIFKVMAEANYFPLQDLSFYLGARAGLGVLKAEVAGIGDSTTKPAAGAHMGMNFIVAPSIAAGGQMHLIGVFGNSSTTTDLGFLGSLSYLF